MKKLYWHYATITIPAGATIYKAADHTERTLVVPLTVRAKRLVTRHDQPLSLAWQFIDGPYAYTLSITAPGVSVDAERVVGGGK